ncbi:FUSC family protein [Cyanobium sp. HWJ4-Hawea]|uniref:FUSC family protein n=1 Tax=Cyanobium sp. HWJ4-Hawea TaxID=2823713 RepID=UPI0020CE5A93|nr:FUSC family protein [Cyanobium sp. HWJ4-Hawea]MCP9809840.1 FUSC family protein [Cyanobium sp. HWJ4-Hawea]
MAAEAPAATLSLDLRAALVIGLAAALGDATCRGVGLSGDALAFGAVIAALVVRPDFSRWPRLIYPVLLVLVGVCLAIGVSLGLALANVPELFVFGLVAALMQLITLLLPSKLRLLSGVVAIAGVLPLLGTPSWESWRDQMLAIAIGLAVGTLLQLGFTPPEQGALAEKAVKATAGKIGEKPEDPPLAERIRSGLSSPFFWRKLVFASLAYTIGVGIGALTPKYLYFGVVLLLNDSIGATLARVRDRMVGVSLGVLMPLLVFNAMGIGELSIGLVMGGTAALVVALNCRSYLNTALISSGVAFIGYGPLVAWYIPNRWLDYLMGSGLAVVVGLLFFPNSALRRFNALSAAAENSAGSSSTGSSEADISGEQKKALLALLPAAREEALWLGLPPPQPKTN